MQREVVERLLQDKKYEEALEASAQLESSPENKFIRARALIGLDRIEEALSLLVSLEKEKDIKHGDVALTIGLIYSNTKRWKEAEYWFKEASYYDNTRERAERALAEVANYISREIDEKSERIIKVRPIHTDIRLDDVIGLYEVKKYLEENIIDPIMNPKVYDMIGKKRSTGLILYGSPGVGKTLIAKAIAGQSRAYFLQMNLSQIISSYAGNTPKNVDALFLQARMHTPCILFIDEIDVIAAKRGNQYDMSSGVMQQAVNKFLTELQGIESDNTGLYILSATNRPWDIDPAIKRSGRLGDMLYVSLPKARERRLLVEYFVNKVIKRGIPTEVDSKRIERATTLYSPSDIEAIMDKSLTHYLKDLKKYKDIKEGMLKTPFTTKHILAALREFRSPTPHWFSATKKELLGEPQYDAKNDEYRYEGGKLSQEEWMSYMPLLQEILRNSDQRVVIASKLVRGWATWVS
jgi:transitional endoplasmic reticulum ATPase